MQYLSPATVTRINGLNIWYFSSFNPHVSNSLRYILIFMKVKSSMESMGGNSTNTANEYDLAKKLALIVATDFLCWVCEQYRNVTPVS